MSDRCITETTNQNLCSSIKHELDQNDDAVVSQIISIFFFCHSYSYFNYCEAWPTVTSDKYSTETSNLRTSSSTRRENSSWRTLVSRSCLTLFSHDGKVCILKFNSKCAFWITQCTHERSNCDIWITQCTHERPNLQFCVRERGEEAWLCLGIRCAVYVSCA